MSVTKYALYFALHVLPEFWYLCFDVFGKSRRSNTPRVPIEDPLLSECVESGEWCYLRYAGTVAVLINKWIVLTRYVALVRNQMCR
jgi:hypothetical protein